MKDDNRFSKTINRLLSFHFSIHFVIEINVEQSIYGTFPISIQLQVYIAMVKVRCNKKILTMIMKIINKFNEMRNNSTVNNHCIRLSIAFESCTYLMKNSIVLATITNVS